MARPTGRFDLQGHRGARGLAPENTLAGFALALDLGVTTLETDLGVTRDGVVVLSHDRRLQAAVTRDASGRWLRAPGPAICELDWTELQSFDVGRIDPASEYASSFPHQKPVDGSRIPSLAQLFELGEASGKATRYNIETKISPLHPGETHDPETFVALVIDVVRAFGVCQRVTIQSFDWRTLLVAQRFAPQIATAALTIDTPEAWNARSAEGEASPWLAGIDQGRKETSVVELVKAAGCSIWSPFWRNVDSALVAEAHLKGLSVVPWTVNDPADMTWLLDVGVDGLITDYPNLAGGILAGRNMTAQS